MSKATGSSPSEGSGRRSPEAVTSILDSSFQVPGRAVERLVGGIGTPGERLISGDAGGYSIRGLEVYPCPMGRMWFPRGVAGVWRIVAASETPRVVPHGASLHWGGSGMDWCPLASWRKGCRVRRDQGLAVRPAAISLILGASALPTASWPARFQWVSRG